MNAFCSKPRRGGLFIERVSWNPFELFFSDPAHSRRCQVGSSPVFQPRAEVLVPALPKWAGSLKNKREVVVPASNWAYGFLHDLFPSVSDYIMVRVLRRGMRKQ